MEQIYDYRDWCRLCASLEGASEASQTNLQFIQEIFKISKSDVLRICSLCNDYLTEINELIGRARELERMFNGLADENASDLTTDRLNAYRAHFNLSQIEADVTDGKAENEDEQLEFINEYEDALDETEVEECQEIIEEHVESPGENYEIEEETYLEEVEEEEVVDDSLVCYDYQETPPRPSATFRDKTEDEKLFAFKCHLCDHSEFGKMKLLASHCKQAHDTLPKVKCCSTKCEAVLSTWRRLLIHKERHFPNSERLRCTECDKVYISLFYLERHMESHKISHICSQCGKNFKEIKTLRAHEATHLKPVDERRLNFCPYDDCSMKFITKQACQNHMAMKHEKVVSIVCSEPNCGKGFFTRKACQEHVKNTHAERNFFCDQCNFKAKTKSALRVHRDTHSTSNNYVCDICSISFATIRRLRCHMISHSGEKPFHCQQCTAVFKRLNDLKSHTLNIHSKVRPHKCPFCLKVFSNSANLRKHKLKEHLGEVKVWEADHGVGGRKKLKCYK